MYNNIFISSGAYHQKSLKELIQYCIGHSLANLELSSNINYDSCYLDILREYHGNPMKYMIHNYFPRPKEDFVLNLASDNQDIIRLSMEHCKKAVDLSGFLGVPVFTVHSGFAFHAEPSDLSNSQTGLSRIPYEKAYDIFVQSVKELSAYASKRGVKFAVENNVVAHFNLVEGRNEILLLADAEEAVKFYNDVASDNLYFLIDMGHLNVSSTSLNFDKFDYLEKVLPHTAVFHLSDNDGMEDQHCSFGENVWFENIISENKDKIFVIETRGTSIEELKRSVNLIESFID